MVNEEIFGKFARMAKSCQKLNIDWLFIQSNTL